MKKITKITRQQAGQVELISGHQDEAFEPRAVAWAVGHNRAGADVALGRTQRHARERLTVWNGQRVESRPLSRAPAWVWEHPKLSYALELVDATLVDATQ